jgi:hypothetical protein
MQNNESGKLVMEPPPDSWDVFGVWQELPTHSILWWRIVRLGGALLLGVVAFVGGTLWNKRIIRETEEEKDDEEVSPPYVL